MQKPKFNIGDKIKRTGDKPVEGTITKITPTTYIHHPFRYYIDYYENNKRYSMTTLTINEFTLIDNGLQKAIKRILKDDHKE